MNRNFFVKAVAIFKHSDDFVTNIYVILKNHNYFVVLFVYWCRFMKNTQKY